VRKIPDFRALRAHLSVCLAAGLLILSAEIASASTGCSVVHHPAPTDADTAFLAADFSKAADLYRATLASKPEQTEAAVGLIHALLKQQKVLEAKDVVQTLIGDKPASADLLTLRGEVELRSGEPWTAAETAAASAKLDLCKPENLLLLSRLASLSSRNATALKLLSAAHQLDPADPAIRSAWLDSLPIAQRIPELESYLAVPEGDDAELVEERKAQLEQLKKWAEAERPPCTLATSARGTIIPFTSIRTQRGDESYGAFDLTVNQRNIRLSLDTSYNARLPIDGVSGLLILKGAADRMGLVPIFHNMVPGIGPQKPRAGYVAIAESIKIGDLEFRNCAVQVMEGPYWSDADGSISTNLLSDFLITINFPNHKISLQPLPALPPGNSTHGLTDRFVAPEMKDFTPIYRVGTDLLLPTTVNRKFSELLLITTAMKYTTLSPEASHEIADGRRDSKYEVRDLSGTAETKFSAGDVSLSFAGFTQNVTHIASFDTARFTRDAGSEVSGLLGDATLLNTTMSIDLRDGLIKLEFDSQHPNAYKH
jgi:hypothetical protein